MEGGVIKRTLSFISAFASHYTALSFQSFTVITKKSWLSSFYRNWYFTRDIKLIITIIAAVLVWNTNLSLCTTDVNYPFRNILLNNKYDAKNVCYIHRLREMYFHAKFRMKCVLRLICQTLFIAGFATELFGKYQIYGFGILNKSQQSDMRFANCWYMLYNVIFFFWRLTVG